MSSKIESNYVPLNNLDEADHRLPPQGVEDLFDEIPYEPTLEELYAGATPAELQHMAHQAFYDGLEAQLKSAESVNHRLLRKKVNKTPDDLVCQALGIAINHVRKYHSGNRGSGVQITDRIQNAALNLCRAVTKFDSSRDVSLFGVVKPRLDTTILRYERGGRNSISYGDLIRVSPLRQGYFRIKNFRAGAEYALGRPVELEELGQFGVINPEDIEEYKKTLRIYEPFNEMDEETQQACGYEPGPADNYPKSSPDQGLTPTVSSILTKIEREVLVVRYGLRNGDEPKTLKETSKVIGVAHQYVSKIEREAINKLRAIPNIIEVVNGVERAKARHSSDAESRSANSLLPQSG